jgi:hypothetical protein
MVARPPVREDPPGAVLPSPGHDHAPTPPPRAAAAPAITRRAILLGLALIPFNVYWVGMTEGVWHGLHFTCLSLPMAAVAYLLALQLTNLGLRRWRPAWVFSQAELLAVFSMLAVSGILCGHDRLVTLMGIVAHPRRFATPENGWERLFFPYLPSWLVVRDPEAAFYYYNGGASYLDYWPHWVRPALGWTAFSLLLFGTLLCLTVLFRKRWTEEERLSYPMIQIPLAMTDPHCGFWQNRTMWLGFALAAGLDLLNGLHYLYPAVPAIPYWGDDLDLSRWATQRPWNAIGPTRADWYPFLIGLAFLLPMDIIFSTWLFYLVGKAQLVFGAATGLQELNPRYPYQGLQAAGAILMIALTALWEARGYLRQVWRRALGRRSDLDDAGEALSYRAALLGTGAGFAGLCAFAVACGMSFTLAAVYFSLFFLIALAVARLRADSGAPAHGLAAVNPQDLLIACLGTAGQDPRALTTLSVFQWFNRFNRAHPMPQQLESLKIAQVLRLEQRRMALAITLAAVATLLLAFVIYPALMYRNGAALAAELMWTGWATYGTAGLQGWLQSPRPPDPAGMAAAGGGAAVALLLALLRSRFVGFPLHPMGYALGMGTTVDRWWFALVLCTVIKGLIVRYGGVRGFQKAVPFFMGLVLGQYTLACFWSILAIARNEPMYWVWLG